MKEVISMTEDIKKFNVVSVNKVPSPSIENVTIFNALVSFERLPKDISLEEIACYANISKSTVLNLFNRFLHITPINYLIGYRLKKAALLIKNTEKKINTISYETGFHNVDYFCRAFKKSYKMTPTEYRKSKNSTVQ